jgi:Skp family chaperone for outer membrane proteins
MRLLTTATLLLGLIAGLAGCIPESSSGPGGVAVLDLDQVGEKLGRLELMSQSIDRYNENQHTALIQLQDRLRGQVATLKKDLGTKPGKKQLREFEELTRSVDSQLQAATNQANQQIAEYRAAQIKAFRDEALPIAQRAAKARGLSVVMLRQEHYLWVDPAVDITQDVIKAMSD